MTKNNLYHGARKLRATGVLFLALALSTFPMAFSHAVKAQAPAKATAQTPAKTTAAPGAESKGGQKEGIKVHGHWTIDVRNPDGTLVTHREFENSIQGSGTRVLAQLLGRNFSVGEWSIVLDHEGSSTKPCVFLIGNTFNYNACTITEANGHTSDDPTHAQFKTLVVDVNPNGVLVHLSGSATFIGAVGQQQGSLNSVATRIVPCASGVAPQDCKSDTASASTAYIFTSTILDSPLTLEVGQIIQVKVVISFS
jgi:hypothetical protein